MQCADDIAGINVYFYNTLWQIQGDQKFCAPDDYSTKTPKNILNGFKHLPQ
jgi:hypothetical protein